MWSVFIFNIYINFIDYMRVSFIEFIDKRSFKKHIDTNIKLPNIELNDDRNIWN